MGVYSCHLCDKTVKLKHKKKHLKIKSHMYLSESIINKHCVKTPELIKIEQTSQKQVNNYNGRFEFHQFLCKWKLRFVGITIGVKSKRTYSNGSRCGLIRFLMRKNEDFRRHGLRFSRISEINITFIISLHLMTYEHYINQSMQIVERIPNEKLSKNPEIVKILKNAHLTLHIGRKQITLDEG